jgi:surface protein
MDLTSYLLGKEAGGGGGTPTLQSKEVEITENGQTTVTADSGYDGLSSVAVTTNVSGGGDLSEYFNDTITSTSSSGKDTLNKLVKKLPEITVANNVTSLANAFTYLKVEEFSKITFGTNITSLSNMFSNCSNVSSIDTSGFNTSNVTNFYGMFDSCSNLENLDFNNINVSSGTDFRNMFSSCSKIKNINASSWISQNAQTMNSMFDSCRLLTSIDLSSFTTPNLTDTAYMFSNCQALQHLDIRNMIFDNVSSYSYMFRSVPNNCEIIVKDDTQKTWITSNFSNLTNVKTVAEL